MQSSNTRIYNEFLNEYLNHYNNLYTTMRSERGINLVEYQKQKTKLREKIEDLMKHFIFFGSSATIVVSLDTLAHADALQASKEYFNIEEDTQRLDEEPVEENKPEEKPQPVVTKAYLLHRYKIIFNKYKDAFNVCTKQSAVEAMSRSLEAELKVVNDYAIEHGMALDEVTSILNEATELWGIHNCMSK